MSSVHHVFFFFFFKVPTINIPAVTKVKILSIREGISLQKTIRDRNNEFRIIPGSIIIYIQLNVRNS